MRKRRRLKTSFPVGYPYVLLHIEGKYVIASSRQQAWQRANVKRAKINYVMVSDLLAREGHAGTRHFLSQFGDTWMTKEGKVFYPEKVFANVRHNV